MTLEQTINADAASKYRGISCFTNSLGARQRWAKSHYLRTSICSNFFNKIGLTKVEDVSLDVSYDLCENSKKRSHKQLDKLKNEIQNCGNPFSTQNEKSLVNIGSGAIATEEIEKYVLNIFHSGRQQQSNFIKECLNSPIRFKFNSPIKKNTISNFASGSLISKRNNNNSSVKVIKFERNLFARILRMSLKETMNMESVLSFPITPIPLALCHPDGTMYKTNKSQLIKILESEVKSLPPNSYDTIIYDAMSLLHALGDLPAKYGDVVKHILKKICVQPANDIRLIFDSYKTPSIKDFERNKRSHTRNTQYIITGAQQKRPPNFQNALLSDSFKINFITFLVDHLCNSGSSYGDIILNKKFYITTDDKCYLFIISNGLIKCEEVLKLYCLQEEADTKITFHLNLIENQSSNVVIQAIDTDLLVIILGNMHNFEKLNVWLEVGRTSNNSRRYIDASKIYKKLGNQICSSLPAFHALTGCDYTL